MGFIQGDKRLPYTLYLPGTVRILCVCVVCVRKKERERGRSREREKEYMNVHVDKLYSVCVCMHKR